jgi:hypothetical protein
VSELRVPDTSHLKIDQRKEGEEAGSLDGGGSSAASTCGSGDSPACRGAGGGGRRAAPDTAARDQHASGSPGSCSSSLTAASSMSTSTASLGRAPSGGMLGPLEVLARPAGDRRSPLVSPLGCWAPDLTACLGMACPGDCNGGVFCGAPAPALAVPGADRRAAAQRRASDASGGGHSGPLVALAAAPGSDAQQAPFASHLQLGSLTSPRGGPLGPAGSSAPTSPAGDLLLAQQLALDSGLWGNSISPTTMATGYGGGPPRRRPDMLPAAAFASPLASRPMEGLPQFAMPSQQQLLCEFAGAAVAAQQQQQQAAMNAVAAQRAVQQYALAQQNLAQAELQVMQQLQLAAAAQQLPGGGYLPATSAPPPAGGADMASLSSFLGGASMQMMAPLVQPGGGGGATADQRALLGMLLQQQMRQQLLAACP